MRTRHQTLKGRGQLVSRRTGKAHQVAYRFEITFRIYDAPGEAPMESQFEARGSVRTVDGPTLPNEDYDLHTEGASYHVWRDEERWHIEAPPANSESVRVIDATTVL